MILETYGLIKSIFPFIKEIFLWRDGAVAGKPITKKDLTRRKIATYVMACSLFLNYVLVVKTTQLGSSIVEFKKREVVMAQEILNSKEACLAPPAAVSQPSDVPALVDKALKKAVKRVASEPHAR
jgi:hypothetical protein